MDPATNNAVKALTDELRALHGTPHYDAPDPSRVFRGIVVITGRDNHRDHPMRPPSQQPQMLPVRTTPGA